MKLIRIRYMIRDFSLGEQVNWSECNESCTEHSPLITRHPEYFACCCSFFKSRISVCAALVSISLMNCPQLRITANVSCDLYDLPNEIGVFLFKRSNHISLFSSSPYVQCCFILLTKHSTVSNFQLYFVYTF